MGNGFSPMYCKTCRHNLRELLHDYCPQCGRRFHPRRVRTYARRPYRLGIPGGRWLIYVLIAFFVLLGITHGLPRVLYGEAHENGDGRGK